MENECENILQMKGITKRFPGVIALDDVSFDVRKGEVHVLLGENGAGKSTLIKIISGAYKKDAGEIWIDGVPTDISGPHHAQQLGVATVYQEFNLIPYLSVAENIFMGRHPIRGRILPIIDKAKMNAQAKELLHYLAIDINPKALIWKLGVAEKQMVEIAKVFSVKSKVCIFDEPTATLTSEEKNQLFKLIRKLKDEKIGIIFISHRLEEVFEIGDRITVMRNGQYVATKNKTEVSSSDLVEMMVGRKIEEMVFRSNAEIGDEVLRVEKLCGKKFKDISIHIRKGEIVGLAGLVGSGRTEVLRAVFGADRFKSGAVFLNGREVKISKPQDAVSRKIALLPEDRKKQGLIMCLSVGDNIIISSYGNVSRFGVINKPKIINLVKQYISTLSIKTLNHKQPVMYLSGGNQQKVIIARWLSANSDFIMFDEPTRGIDVGAKQEVYTLMVRMANEGKAILVVSSEIPELLKICSRVYVMHEGRISAELAHENLTSDQILNAAFGRNKEST